MNLKNYTSSVPADRSISYIERSLALAGARNINKEYRPGTDQVEALMFQMEIRDGKSNRLIPMIFKLPVHVEEVFKVMYQEVRRPRPETEKRIRDQSHRTAWKILHDWVSVQVTMIRLEQAAPLEIFLPYAWDPAKNKTFFQHVQDGGFKLLPGPVESK
ncbi:MAG: hypothetical protein RDU76_06195 [Candidatus Edwardsbacteria bacterium]|nr:hypothetical protein [Candidatus Edwardsbacteria bacterium]